LDFFWIFFEFFSFTHTTLIGWVLAKKLWTVFNKRLLTGKYNAIVNILIYSIDFLLFVLKRPFRDNTVNFSQAISTFSNMLAIVIAALPHMISEDEVPRFLTGTLVMWVTSASTGVLVIAAALDPVWAFLSHGVKLTVLSRKGAPAVAAGRGMLVALWVRFQIIFMTRQKAASNTRIKQAKDKQKIRQTEKEEGEVKVEGKPEIDFVEHAEIVQQKAHFNHRWYVE